MSELNGVRCSIKFENPICDIGSCLDGENLYDLIEWHEEIEGNLCFKTIPAVGEVIYKDSFWMEVTGVMHKMFHLSDEISFTHNVVIRVKQIPLSDPRTNW